MLNSKQIIEQIRIGASKRLTMSGYTLRKGQAIYQAAYEIVPETVELDAVKYHDPFNNSALVEDFLSAIEAKIDENNKNMNKNPYEHPYAPNKLPAKFEFVKVYCKMVESVVMYFGYWNGDSWRRLNMDSDNKFSSQYLHNVVGWSEITA